MNYSSSSENLTRLLDKFFLFVNLTLAFLNEAELNNINVDTYQDNFNYHQTLEQQIDPFQAHDSALNYNQTLGC